MKTSIKSQSKKVILYLIIGFMLLFIFRLVYGYDSTPSQTQVFNQSEVFQEILDLRKNYASKKHKVIAGQAPVRIDQKYEKIAEINSNSNTFDQAESSIRKQIKDYNGLIQFENKNGNKGYRNLSLVIGVPPENFDSIYQQLIKIGAIQAKQITKKDKTNEYKELNARKHSLEKIRTSLISLKSEGGRIEEYMQLENRILEVEQQLQELGVSLGNFDEENEFCTVKFSLSETVISHISLLHRIKVALEWTISTYLKLLLALSLMAGFAYLSTLTFDKIRNKKQ